MQSDWVVVVGVELGTVLLVTRRSDVSLRMSCIRESCKKQSATSIRSKMVGDD